jgi:hypothetical protein
VTVLFKLASQLQIVCGTTFKAMILIGLPILVELPAISQAQVQTEKARHQVCKGMLEERG